MIWILPALLLHIPAAASRDLPASAQPATIFATIGHSEWCPAGNVQLDLRTGDYAVTTRARRPLCQDPKLVRPIQRGRLDSATLDKVGAAYTNAQSEGLDACGNGKPEDIIISNGGTPVLVLTNGAGTTAAPSNYSCWSKAAFALHQALEAPFEPLHQR